MSADAVSEFLGAMEAAGIRPVEAIAPALVSGTLVRFRCEGDGPGKRNGWAILHLDDRPAGAFGWWKAGRRHSWSSAQSMPLSDDERRRLRSEWRERAERRARAKQAQQEAAAGDAVRLWSEAGAVDQHHPYLARKAIRGEDIRQIGDHLLIPMRDITGRLWNVQRIAPDGFKAFVPGARVSGLLCIIGSGGNRACLGEGYATMAAVRRATGMPAIVAFSAGNLEPVARAVRRQWPGLDVTICADDDAHLVHHPQVRRNVGLECARAAAAAAGARLAVPRMELR